MKNVETTKDAWENVQKVFQGNGLLRRFVLLDKLASANVEKIGSVEDYVVEPERNWVRGKRSAASIDLVEEFPGVLQPHDNGNGSFGRRVDG